MVWMKWQGKGTGLDVMCPWSQKRSDVRSQMLRTRLTCMLPLRTIWTRLGRVSQHSPCPTMHYIMLIVIIHSYFNFILKAAWFIYACLTMRSTNLIHQQTIQLLTIRYETRHGVQQCQAQKDWYVVFDWVWVRTKLGCVRLTNQNFWLDGSKASFLVPSYSPSKS